MRKRNKKGSIGDLFFILLVITVTGIVFITGWMAMSKVNDKFQAGDQLSQSGKDIMQDSSDNYVASLDGVFLTLFIAMYLGSILLAFNIDAHPAFFFLSIIIFAVLVLITAVMANAFWEFTNNAEVISYASDFTIIPFIFNNLVQVFIVMGFGLAGVIFAKVR